MINEKCCAWLVGLYRYEGAGGERRVIKGRFEIDECFLTKLCQKMFSAWSRRARLFLREREFPYKGIEKWLAVELMCRALSERLFGEQCGNR